MSETKPETKTAREEIKYLVCSVCKVVFPDRDEPQCCPICAAGAEQFISYDKYLTDRAVK